MPEIQIPPPPIKDVVSFEGVATPPGTDSRQAQLAKAFDAPQQTSTNQPSSNEELSLDDFESDDKPIIKAPESKSSTEELQEGEQVETEDIKEEKKELPTFEIEPKKEEKIIENPPFRPAKRNYDQFDQEDIPALKKLPNVHFDLVKNYAKQKAELKTQVAKLNEDVTKLKAGNLPDSYHEHPQAYTLTKEFQDLSTQLTYDNFEEQHWTEQLRAIKSGQDWYDIKGYDEKTGQPVYELRKAQEEGVDFNSEILVSKYLNNVNSNKSSRSMQVQRLQVGYQQFHNQAIQSIKEAENRFFPSWSDPSKISSEAKKNMDLVTNIIHPAFKNHPSTPLLAKSYAYIHQLVSAIKERDEKIRILEDKTQDRIKAGPSNRQFGAIGQNSNTGGKMISEKDFES